MNAFGPTAIRFVFPEAKVGANFYIKKFSSRFSEEDISCLFGKEANSAVLHHDSVRGHMATVQWPENFGYNFIPARDWAANSPDLLALDYSADGILSADFRSGRHAAWTD